MSHLNEFSAKFPSSVCIYEKRMHEVRRLIPKMREIFTNRLRNVSASIIARAKRSVVKRTILQHIYRRHRKLRL